MSDLCRSCSITRTGSFTPAMGCSLAAPAVAQPFRPLGSTSCRNPMRLQATAERYSQPMGPSRGSTFAAGCQPRGRSRRSVRVRAQQEDNAGGVLGLITNSCSKFLERYDPVAIGTGSLAVTACCYFVQGQSLEEAFNLTLASTVVGMVAQELLFNSSDGSEQ